MKTVLIYCSNGYFFEEFYFSIIKELENTCNIILLLEYGYIPDQSLQIVKNLFESKSIQDYHLTRIHTERSSRQRYLRGIEVINKLKGKKIDLFLLGSDFIEVDQYLINHVSSNGGKSVVVGDGLFEDIFFEDYYKLKGLPLDDLVKEGATRSWKQKIRNKSAIDIVKGGISLAFRPVLKFKIKIRTNAFLNYRLIPFFMFRKTFTKNAFTKYSFAVGVADYVIVTDPIEYDGLKLLIPTIKKMFWAKHPSYDLFKNSDKKGRTKLLVIITTGMGLKSPDHKIKRWVTVVEEIKRLKNPVEIHLRFHPREQLPLKKRFEDAFRANNIQTVTLNTTKYALPEKFCEYMGVVGSRSGTLRFCRTASHKIFVIGLVDGIHSGFYGKPINMGNSEGI
ncbi:MAG: hypothetical protein HN486_03815 [Flavobacteriaceae bacterium]|nr:hypothetical protein [Flavobacteriaceae bacterium]